MEFYLSGIREKLAGLWGCAPGEVPRYARNPRHHPLEDQVILDLIRSDERILREYGVTYLLKKTRPLILKLARRYELEDMDVEDLVQNAYLGLYQQICKPDWAPERSKLSTYLYQIALNMCNRDSATKRRMVKAIGHPAAAEEGETVPGTAPDPLALLERQEYRDAINAFIDQLPPKRTEVLRLRFFEEKTYEEIQAYYGHSDLQTSRNLVNTAKNALANLMAADPRFQHLVRKKKK